MIIAILGFIAFIITFLGVLMGAHFLLYISIIRFFSITNGSARVYLLSILLFLSVSFILSAFLVRLHTNSLTSGFYVFSSVWLGLLVHLIMALAIIWPAYGLFKISGYVLDTRMISIVCFILAAAVSLYGIWNAFHPRLKHIVVKIQKLPQTWENKTIVQLSDLHLGNIHRKAFMQDVVNRVNGLHPDLILITGDLFDGMGGALASFIEPLNTLEASKGVFFVTGNHEEYLGRRRPLSIVKKTHINILDNRVVELDGLQIVGISFPKPGSLAAVKSIFGPEGDYNPDKPSILMYHTPTNIHSSDNDLGSQHNSIYWSPDTSMRLAKEYGIDLQLSGHTHKGQLFPFGWVTKIIYKGYDYGLHKEGAFTLNTTSGVGTWGPPMRTGSPGEIVVIKLLRS